MAEKAMTFPRRDRGPARAVRSEGRVDYKDGRPVWIPNVIRLYTGTRKALRV